MNYITGIKCYKNHSLEQGYETTVNSFSFAKPYKDGYRRSNDWQYCRELFSSTLSRRRSEDSILFFKDAKQGDEGHSKQIAAFFDIIETKLDVQPRSEFIGLKHASTVTGVKLSPWWKANGARRSLFTILLRCGINFTGNNFEEALYSTDYAKQTKKAIQRFFDGYTNCSVPVGGFNGWVARFSNDESYRKKTEDERIQILTK